jgi:branched-chain amino acid transport system substrate-binding protein
MIKISKLFAAMVLAGVASHSFAADTIKIGIAGPKTGPVTQYGDMQFIGAKQAIKDINAKGGVDGKMLEAKEYDDACDPKQAVAVANKVVNDGVKFVVGHLCSSSTQPASDIYEDEGVIMITPAATAGNHRPWLQADLPHHRPGQRPGPGRRQLHRRPRQAESRCGTARQAAVR